MSAHDSFPLILPERLGLELRRRARAGYPHEVCGLLVGDDVEGRRQVRRLCAARNLAVDRLADRYLLDPDDFLAADRAAREAGQEIVGIWHTHPDAPPLPSVTDAEAAWAGYSYLIVSIRGDGSTALRSWVFGQNRFREQALEEVRDDLISE